MNWISLSLIAPLFWAASNFADKYTLGKYTNGTFDWTFFSTTASWLFFIILLAIVGLPPLTLYLLIPLLTGVMLIYSYGFYAKALEQGDTSSLVVLFKLIPVVTVILGFVFLGQQLSFHQAVGFFIVLVGAVIVSLEKGEKKFFKGFGMIMIAIIMWAIMTLIVDCGLGYVSFWHYMMVDSLGSALAGLTLFIVPSMRKQVVAGIHSATLKKYTWFTGNNILDFLGQMTIKKALTIAPSAGLVTVVMQVQSFYAIVMGTLLTLTMPFIFKEDITLNNLVKKSIGAIVMFVGIYILLT